MPLVNLETLLKDADEKGYAVPEFNTDNIEITQAILEGAMEESSPIIIGVGQGAIKDGKLEPLAAIIKDYANSTTIPIALHLDHSKSYEQVIKCLTLGFTSIMIDGSELPLNENIALTNKVVEVCKALGVSVEAELGTIGGVEDDIVIGEDEANLVDIEDVKAFVNEVDIDALAVAIGSAHGMYKKEPKLALDLLKEINTLTSVPLVLHGGSGIPKESVQQAISLGINKVNFGTELRIAFIAGLSDAIAENKEIYAMFESGRQKVKKLIKQKIDLCRSNNMAEGFNNKLVMTGGSNK
ncbi:class II fructose-bisphosphate aldolase [Bacillus infantis]|uniref:class II fructose-bisphosphate aldolase n=1 Tax=Bacillus infantis TaxID=324767 RepID=UPI003CF7A15A